jgi:hypothetical protein
LKDDFQWSGIYSVKDSLFDPTCHSILIFITQTSEEGNSKSILGDKKYKDRGQEVQKV